ncbi:MAG: lipoprotein [Gammaproteobacteria bacterium]|nr:lipoprotein [Gammaproteobacteria bacterium]
MIKRTITQKSAVVLLTLYSVFLVGCGQKGPLQLPEPAERSTPAEPSSAMYLIDKSLK